MGYEVLWMSCGGSCGYPKTGFLVAIGRDFAHPHVSNSGYSACCYWHTVLVTPQILDFSWEPVHHVTSVISQCDPALICIRPLVIRDPAILVTPSMTLSSLRPRP